MRIHRCTEYRRQKTDKGFILVEIIISIFLILILFELLIMEAGVLLVSKSQRYENIAYHIANKQMESLRATEFSTLLSSGVISDSLLAQIPSGSGSFSVSDHLTYNGLKELEVRVTWNDGGDKSVVLKTIAGRGGLNQ